MGQYYHVIVRKNGRNKVYNLQTKDWELAKKKDEHNCWQLYNGLKLMEHSWWFNDFCTAFAETLLDKPAKVCWCGDYAGREECKALGFKYARVWRGSNVAIKTSDFELNSVKYLINNDKKLYLNLESYFKRCVTKEEWNGKIYDRCIFPISLLTALGNNRGGGDFREGNKGFKDVGTWAFDEIYISNTLPEGYTEKRYTFKEE